LQKTKIQSKREEIGISRTELARRSKVPLRTLEEIESQRRKDPRGSTLRAIATALGCLVDDLIEAQK
jgi:transcriptional regulator with XRE-family HTH domain